MSRRVLVVDPHEHFRQSLSALAAELGCLTFTRATFQEARADIAAAPPTILIAHLKLGSFNGIHLAYLARQANPSTTCIVYGDDDPGLGLEAQRAGAFWERSDALPLALPHYLMASLPPVDRRDARYVDRRLTFRGGRRATDIASLYRAPAAS